MRGGGIEGLPALFDQPVKTVAADFVALEPPIVLFILFGLYVASGPIMTLIKLRQVKKQRFLKPRG